VQWCADGEFLCRVFSASCVQHISDLHSKCALRPHHVWKVWYTSILRPPRIGEKRRNHGLHLLRRAATVIK